jgi:hypothetical protein
MKPSDIWKLKQDIIQNRFTFQKGDMVSVSHRKSTGYPARMKDGVLYEVHSTHGEYLEIYDPKHSQTFRVHRYYVLHKTILRDRKIDEILNEDN